MKTIAQELGIKEFPFEITDNNKNLIYYEKDDGYWARYEYNEKGEEIYYENSNGLIQDDRPTMIELTIEEIANKFRIPIEKLRIKSK